MNVASIKDRLKNIVNKTGKNFQDLLIAYGLERTIYKISISKYNTKFVLKGGIFLYALNDGNYSRVTTDIDILAINISNDINRMREIFSEIFSIKCDDGLEYDLDSMRIKEITNTKEYHGVNVSIIAFLDKTQIPVSIDIGFDDVIYPSRVEMSFPVLLNNEHPLIYAYSIYSVISEKFEAIVSLGIANSRYKDYYDIYVIATTQDLEGKLLKKAIEETFTHRQTSLDDIVSFNEEYIGDQTNIQRWNMFVKKKKALVKISFSDVMIVIKQLLLPVIDAITDKKEFNKHWDKNQKRWY